METQPHSSSFGSDPLAEIANEQEEIRRRYSYYFCDLAHLVKSPSLVAYYRNMAMVSTQVIQDIGLDTADHEAGQPLSLNKAEQLAQYFNSTVSTFIIENPSLVTSRLHIAMVFSNLGESIGTSWRNEVKG